MATKSKTTYKIGEHPKLDFSLMPPYQKQKEFIEHPARVKVVAFGRQSGKSWAARRMLLDRAANLGQRCWWVFPVYRAAKSHWFELLNLLERTGFPVKAIKRDEMTIEFYSGGYITIRSADEPDSLRGPTLDFIVLDEAAFMPEDVWYKVLFPTLTASRGSALIISTPNGRNWFYALWLLGQDDRYPLYASWRMSSADSPYQDKETLDVIKATTPKEIWEQEYLAEFIADGGGVFAGLERAANIQAIVIPQESAIPRYVAGVDWGDSGDYTVFTVIDKITRSQVYGERFVSFGTTKTVERVIELLHHWEPEITYVETNGIGVPLFNLLREKLGTNEDLAGADEPDDDVAGIYGGFRIRGVHSDNEKKRAMIERLAVDIEWGRLNILAERQDDVALDLYAKQQISEMSTFERKRTKTNLVTYGAPEGNHDDTIIGLSLAYIGVPRPKKKDFKKHWEKTQPDTGVKNPFRNRR